MREREKPGGATAATGRPVGKGQPSSLPLDQPRASRELCLFLVAGEHSGDALGARLMQVINARRRGRVQIGRAHV